MGKLGFLILKICLGVFAATNFIVCIITTNIKIIIPINVLVAIFCFFIIIYIEIKISNLAKDLRITRVGTRRLIGDYFEYYKDVERISIDDFLERNLHNQSYK